MRTALATLACLTMTTALPLPAQQPVARGWRVLPTASIRFTAVSPNTIVRVIGWERDSLEIRGTLAAGDRLDGGAGRDGRMAKVYVERPERSAAADPVRVELRVPARGRVWVKLGEGEIELSGVRGAADLNVVSGAIRVRGALRELTAEAMDGEVTIDGRADWLRAKTAGGSIALTGGGDDVSLTSVSGGVTARGGPLGRARLETVTGDIRVAADLPRAADLSLESHSGRVELLMPADAGADVDVITVRGEIHNELTDARPVAGAGQRGQELGFTTGGGGRTVTIRTFKGTVVVGRMPPRE